MKRLIHLRKKDSPSVVPISQEEFEKEFQITYLPSLVFENHSTEKKIRQQCKKGIKNHSIDEERQWLGALYSDKLEIGSVANIYIQYIDPQLGYGVFAAQEIPAYKYIGEYTGLVRKHPLFKNIINPYCFSYPTSIFSLRKHSIDALKSGNETRFINHSLQPNCESIAVYYNGLLHIIIRSIKPIPKDAQILYDYGNDFIP